MLERPFKFSPFKETMITEPNVVTTATGSQEFTNFTFPVASSK